MCAGCIKCGCGRSCLECLHGDEGTGPAEADVQSTHVDFTFQSTDADGAHSVLRARTDEMYLFTAQALAEAGLCLRYDYESLPMKGGHATPAAALGSPYLSRLVNNKFIEFSS